MSEDATTEEEKIKRDELLLNLIERRYDSELERISAIDGKANSLIGIVSIIVGLLIGLAGFELLDKLKDPNLWWIYFAGIASLLCSIIFSMYALKVRKWVFVPNVEHLWNIYTEKAYRVVIRKTASTMKDTIIDMEKENDKKATWVDRGWYGLIVGLILVVIFLVTIALTGGIKPPTT